MSIPEGQVFDLGYRHYDGPREGRTRARRALFVNGIRTSFGLGRGAWAKVLPILFLVSVMAPAAVLSIMAGLLGEVFADALSLPGPQDYYEIVSPILLIFAAVIAPELLCSDRQNGVINLYLVRPLSSSDYVVSRWLSFFAVSLVFIYAGQVVLLGGLVLGSEEPLEYLRENWANVPRFLLAGLTIAACDHHDSTCGSVPDHKAGVCLAGRNRSVRGLYGRGWCVERGRECATTVGDGNNVSGQSADVDSTSGTSVVMTFGNGGESELGDSNTVCKPQFGVAGRWARLLDFAGIPLQVSDLIFDGYDEELTPESDQIRLPPGVSVGWWVIVVAVPAVILWSRYRRLVT